MEVSTPLCYASAATGCALVHWNPGAPGALQELNADSPKDSQMLLQRSEQVRQPLKSKVEAEQAGTESARPSDDSEIEATWKQRMTFGPALLK